MKVAAVLGVKNEITLIDRCLDHLYAIGVDYVIAEDCGSTDGTEDVLAARRGPLLDIFHFDEEQDPISPLDWGRQEVELARRTGADWVIFLDADEFWLPATGHIKDAMIGVQADALSVNRFNVALGQGGLYASLDFQVPDYGQTMMYVKRPPNYRAAVMGNPPMPWIRGVPNPKIIIRPESVDHLRQGHHAAVKPDGTSDRIVASDIVIAHLPFSTRDRFKTKVEHIADTVRLQGKYHAGDTAWHWKRWIELSAQNLLDEEYARQVIDEVSLLDLRAKGEVLSASEYLKRSA